MDSSKILPSVAKNKKAIKPVIYGISGTALTDSEKKFFSENGCLGFILFSRNISNKHQLSLLTKSLREVMEGEVLILIDQEGGRVARMAPPEWREYPSGSYFASMYDEDKSKAKNAVFENFASIAKDLTEVGINVNCAPIVDIVCDKTHAIIESRCYGNEPKKVYELAEQVCGGMLANGVLPVIKHIPGHGRADADSHISLPKVLEDLDTLSKSDFIPFKMLNNMKLAMTAHVLFTKIDDQYPATMSKKVMDLIRNQIGFKNIIMTDDLSMGALSGTMKEKVEGSISAGCDLILHCNGVMDEMTRINAALNKIDDTLISKLLN